MRVVGYSSFTVLPARSGASILYRATRDADGAHVVLKTPRGRPSRAVIDRYTREHAVLKQVAGEGVVPCLGLEQHDGAPVLVLRDMHSASLDMRLASGPCGLRDALTIAAQVARIFARVHAAQVVHKDVNPSNILVSADGHDVQLIDFGISSRVSRERATGASAETQEGTLAYLAPEQSGRMNRSVDARSDLYALGATLYEMLVGRPPFEESEPLALVHAHIARIPTPPHERAARIPLVVSQLTMRLLEKAAEDRYQTALGALEDLERCLASLSDHDKTIAPFELGERDVRGRLQASPRLYGREAEVATLLARFEQVKAGAVAVVRVVGEPGVGKTALVLELRERITPLGGALAAGKCDQLDRGEPFSVLAQAFRQRLRMVLSHRDEEVERMATLARAALGEHVALLASFIPELHTLVGGELQSPPALPAAEAEIRLAIAARRLARCLTSEASPLVLFLDDLQWADGPTIRLLAMLATDPEAAHLLLIVAHRDQAVGPGHPLLVALEDVHARGTEVKALALTPLAQRDVTAFVADTLRSSTAAVEPLAELLFARTSGNPFFLLQMLESLEEDGTIAFHRASGRFDFDAEKVRRALPRADVAELLAERLSRLDPKARALVEGASLIVASFEAGVLAALSGLDAEEVTRLLEGPVAQGLVDVLDARAPERAAWRYAFVHDRVQTIANAHLDAARAGALHLQLGRMLMPEADEGARLFAAVDHLNAARSLISDAAERARLARLNLKAGVRAREAGAYAAALTYLETGMALDGQARSELSTSLAIEAAEAAYLATDFVKMEALSDEVIRHAPNVLARVRAHEVRVNASIGRNDLERALREGIAVLALLDIDLPLSPTKGHVLAGIARTRFALTGWTPERIASLPLATRVEARAAMRIAMGLVSAAYYARPDLLPLIVFSMVRLTLADGLSPESPYAFSVWGLVMASLGAVETGYGYGRLALRLRDRVEDPRARNRAEHLYFAHLAIWKHPFAESRAGLRRTYEAGYTSGDLEYSAFSAMMSCCIGLYAGHELGALAVDMGAFRDAIRSLAMGTSLYTHEIHQQAALCLREGAEEPWRMEGPIYDERVALAVHERAKDATNLFSYRVAKAFLCLVFDQLEVAEPFLAWNRAHSDLAASTVIPQQGLFLDVIISLRRAKTMGALARASILLRVERQLSTMRKWLALCPENWAYRLDLCLAERASLTNAGEATTLYERATVGARAQGDLFVEALASEGAATLHRGLSHSTAEQAYLATARHAYERWGATAKVRALEARFPELEAERRDVSLAGTTRGTGVLSGAALDLSAVFNSAQAISKEIVLSRLVEALVRIAIQAAGASRGVLVLERAGVLHVAAEGNADTDVTVHSLDAPLEGYAIAEGLVRYVQRVRHDVVVDDAQLDGTLRRDRHIIERGVRSVLCVPVEQQGKLSAVLYLEHPRAAGVFTHERVALLRLLSSQAAIAIENARLYDDLRTLADAQARFVPKQFLESLSRPSIVDVRLGDNVQKSMSILFSDIRGFTPLVERMRPEEHIGFINDYLRHMEPPILESGGFVDSYIGDAIMALFDGASGGADEALAAGIGMTRALAALNEERTGSAPIRIGIGLHTGPLTLGTIGGPERIKCGVIGDSVNLAARLEALTKRYDTTLLVSDAFTQKLRDPSLVTLRTIDRVRMRGSAIPVTVYEVLDADPEATRLRKTSTLATYQRGIDAYYRKAPAEAVGHFEESLAHFPEDASAQRFLTRSRALVSAGVPDEWSGVEQA